jgi:hypothetical protein
VASGGKRAGTRRGPRRQRSFSPSLLALAGGVTIAVVAWGYLVYAAIDFGATARSGNPDAWWFLAMASLGAVACLFVALILVARLLRRLGITSGPASAAPTPPSAPSSSPPSSPGPSASDEPEPLGARPVAARPIGGRRAAR